MTDTIPEAVIEAMADEIDPVDHATAIRDLRAALKAAEQAGWKLVPVEPTRWMVADGETAVDNAIDSTQDSYSTYVIEEPGRWAYAAWAAMIAASPEVQ